MFINNPICKCIYNFKKELLLYISQIAFIYFTIKNNILSFDVMKKYYF